MSVAPAPPGTEVGLTLNEVSAGWSVSEAFALAPKRSAVMVPVVAEATAELPMLNVAWFAP